MRTIPIEFFPIEPTFKSAQAAIRHAKNYLPLKQARIEAACAIGSPIVGGRWTDCDLVLQFENGVFLNVFVGQRTKGMPIEWSFGRAFPNVSHDPVDRTDQGSVKLQFKTGEHIMDVGALLSPRIGKPLKNVWVNELSFYVYTPQQLILSLGRVWDVEAQRNILYVFEEV